MRAFVAVVALAFAVAGAWVATRATSDQGPTKVATLGPVDGHDLPPTEIGRVALGTEAPDFFLDSYEGDVVSLSQYRGEKNVVLVFYRGHW